MKKLTKALNRILKPSALKQPKLMLDAWGEEQIKKLKSLKQDMVVMQMSA